MKCLLILVLCIFCMHTDAQTKIEVKQTIDNFFEAFHLKDTVSLKTMVKGNINMQSISENVDGEIQFSENDYNSFLKNISAIPEDKTFEEKLLSFDIKIDGKMSNVWIPYEFWYDGKLSHCGVNSFQLIKENESWKIIYIVDTRRLKECRD